MLQNKKILVVATTDNMISQFLIPHIEYLKSQGNVVECACNKTGFWFDELQEKHNIKCHQIGFARNPLKPANMKAYKALKALQKAEGYEVVYCQQPVGGVMGRMLAKKFKLPCIYTAHGFHFFEGNSALKNLIYKTIEKHFSKYTDALITINEEDYQAALKFKAKSVYKINGIGFSAKKYESDVSRAEMRKSLGLDKEFVILTVAEFIERKNYDTMLRTIAELKDENVKYLICGTGKDKEVIEKLIVELGIEDKVQLLGYRKDINNIMKASDAFFLASHQEGLTLSIIEALSYSLPVITSNVRGNRDLIEDGVNGFVCEQNDYRAFAEKVKVLLNDKELCKKIAAENAKKSKIYNVENVLKQLEEVYKEI